MLRWVAMTQRRVAPALFSIAAALLVGSLASADAPAPRAPAPAVASEEDALLYLEQARLSVLASDRELRVEGDTSEAINYAVEGCSALRTAADLMAQLPPTAAPGR